MSSVPILVGGTGGGSGLPGKGGQGDEKDTAKPIATQLKAAANIEFGQVQAQVVDNVADLRKKLTAAAGGK